ncbi:MAG: DinB family protein [Candidatus Limnocylindrales bacterium]
MTDLATTLDAPFLENTDPTLARLLPAALAGARADVIAAARDLLAIPEAALTRPWGWIGGSEEEVRYAAYRAAEALEQAEVEARVLVAGADGAERRAARIIGPATAARWDLHGLLLPLDEALLDADPGGGEWTIRLTLGHTISSQRGYGWGSAWWLAHPHDLRDPDLPTSVPESYWEALPDEATTEAAGTLGDLRARLDGVLDLMTERLAGLPDDRLDLAARWSGFPVTVGFRFGRWSSHIREHTIQVEKTLVMLDHAPSEPARLVRNLLAAYGRAESVVFGRVGVDDAVARIVRGAAEARETVRSARTAAGA